MTFIFQGNPNRFAIDEYLARYPFVYWSAPRLTRKMCLGDRAIIWRSGDDAGAVAVGHITEMAKSLKDVDHPGALGDDFWRSKTDNPSDVKVGITLSEARLTIEDGMIPRAVLKADPIFSSSHIIKTPQGSVFQLTPIESSRFELYWSGDVVPSNYESNTDISDYEGSLRLRVHYARERSRKIVADKKRRFLEQHGKLQCEVCRVGPGDIYPAEFETPFIEVHHRNPLFDETGPKKTSLDDLILLCANCHRVVHRDRNVQKNLEELELQFSSD